MAQNKTQQHTRPTHITQNIIANIDNGIIVLNDKLQIKLYNRWLEIHTGFKESNIIDRYLYDIFPNISVKTLQRKVKTALKMQTPTFYTASVSKYLIPIKINQLKHTDFEFMQQDVSIIPLDEKENLVALILTDQTNMASANATLEKNLVTIQELNAELLKERDTIDRKILLFKINHTARITDVSQALLKLLKYTKEELLDLNFLEYEGYTLLGTDKEDILNAMKELRVYEFEENSKTADGMPLTFKTTLVPEYSAQGKHIGFILFREDITASRILQETQEKVLSNSRSAAMGEMVSMIAHQWRQPLSLINTVIATLKIKSELEVLDKETTMKSFDSIEKTTTFLSETIDDFRNYFKPDKIISELNLLELFDKSIFFLKGEMNKRGITLNIYTLDDIIIYTYKNELLQTIINILNNSIDAFDNSLQTDKQISVSLKSYPQNVSITIEDNAGGIPKEILQRVFEPYFSTKSKNGTGLGLYMAHTIVTEHLNGSISMSSQGINTSTLIKLPYKLAIKE